MKKKFAEGMNFKKLFWIFVIGSIFGAYYEELLNIVVTLYERNGVFAWEPRRGVFWGPFSPIYGIGAVVMTLILVKKDDSTAKTFFKAAALGGIIEYFVSLFQELILGTVAWDYSKHFLNIGGRTTIPFMLFWGLLGLGFVKIVYPAMSKVIEGIPPKIGEIATKVLFVFLAFDIAISWSAIFRQTLRHNGVRPITIVDKFYDEHFDDEYLQKKFPTTVFK